MSIGGDIMEEHYDKLILSYRDKLKNNIELMSAEYPVFAAQMLEDFDEHFSLQYLK